jgi:sugar/nucleoside kinase (ribokinase family)
MIGPAMTAPAAHRETSATALEGALPRIAGLRSFVGFDGFVDQIVHIVDKRHDAFAYERLRTITAFAERVAAAAGRSTNIEPVPQQTKLGGNGPIMSNALSRLGCQVTYLGALGHPVVDPVFDDFATCAEVHSIANPGRTDALEFDDGKVMLTMSSPLTDITWRNIEDRYGRDQFLRQMSASDLVGFVNWTMIPGMNAIWESLLGALPPAPAGSRGFMFFDLADPEKRTKDDILQALDLIARFEDHFQVVLGLNEKEAREVGNAFGLDTSCSTPEGLEHLSAAIRDKVPVNTLVVHPVRYALTVSDHGITRIDGLCTDTPLITTGAGDHFNAGFCLGKLLGFDDRTCLLTGVTTSGFYVRNARTPTAADLVAQLRDWPADHV